MPPIMPTERIVKVSKSKKVQKCPLVFDDKKFVSILIKERTWKC